MRLWIARDKDGTLFVYENRPIRDKKEGIFIVAPLEGEWDSTELDTLPFSKMFPSVTWENSPQEVELKLCNTEFDRIIEENKDVLQRIKDNGD